MLLIFLCLYIRCEHKENLNDDMHKDLNQNDASDSYIPSGYILVWEDQFNTKDINADYWIKGSLKDPQTGDMVPGAKGEFLLNEQYCGYITDEDSYIENGTLVLRNQKREYEGIDPMGTYEYTSGWAMSMHRVFLNKGYVQIKAKFPSGEKVWPAIWLIAEDLNWGPEWDMFEYFGYREDEGSDNMGMHLCYGLWPDEKWKNAWIKQFNVNYNCETWHIYGFEWTSEFAKWYIDGELVNQIYADDVNEWPDENMYIVLNNGQRTYSPDTSTKWPNYLIIDYIMIFQKNN